MEEIDEISEMDVLDEVGEDIEDKRYTPRSPVSVKIKDIEDKRFAVKLAYKVGDELNEKLLASASGEKVDEEVKTRQSGKPSIGGHKHVIANGIPPDTTPTILKRLFPQAKNIVLPTTKDGFSPGYAIVIMPSVEAARKMLDEKKEYRIGEKVLRVFMKKTGTNIGNQRGRGFNRFGPNRGKYTNRGHAFKKRGTAFRGRGGFRGRGNNFNSNNRFIEPDHFDGNVTFDQRQDTRNPDFEHWDRESFHDFGDELYRDDREPEQFSQHRYSEDLDRDEDRLQTDTAYDSSSFRDDYGEARQTRDDVHFEERQNFNDNPHKRGGRGKYRGSSKFRGRGRAHQVGRFSDPHSRYVPKEKSHDMRRSHDHFNNSNYSGSHHFEHDELIDRQRIEEDFFDDDVPKSQGQGYRGDRHEGDNYHDERYRTERHIYDDSERHMIEVDQNADDDYRSEEDHYSEISRGRSWQDQYNEADRGRKDRYDDNFNEHDKISEEKYVEEWEREQLEREWPQHGNTNDNRDSQSVVDNRNRQRGNYRGRNQKRGGLYREQHKRDQSYDRNSLEREEWQHDNKERQDKLDRSGKERERGRKSSHYERFPEDRWMEDAPEAKRHELGRDSVEPDDTPASDRFETSRTSREDEEDYQLRDAHPVLASHRSRSPNARVERDQFLAAPPRGPEEDVMETRAGDESVVFSRQRRLISQHDSMVYQAPVLELPRPLTPDGGVLLTRTLEGGLIVSRPQVSPLKPVVPVTPERLSFAPSLQTVSPDQGGILVTRTLTGEIVVSNAEASIANVLPIPPIVEATDMLNTSDRNILLHGNPSSANLERPSRSDLHDSSHETRSAKRQSSKEHLDRSMRSRSPSVTYSYSGNSNDRRHTSRSVNNSKQEYNQLNEYKARQRQHNAKQQDINLRNRDKHYAAHSEQGFGRNRGEDEDDIVSNDVNSRNSNRPHVPHSEYGASKSRHQDRDTDYFPTKNANFKNRDFNRDRSRSPPSRYHSDKNRTERGNETDFVKKGNFRNNNRDRYHTENETVKLREEDRHADDFHEKDRNRTNHSEYGSTNYMDKDFDDNRESPYRKQFDNQKDPNFRNYQRDRNSQVRKSHHEENWQRSQSVSQRESLDKHSQHSERFQHKQQSNLSNKFRKTRYTRGPDLEPVDSDDSCEDFSNISRSVKSQKGRHASRQRALADHNDLRITVRSNQFNQRSLNQSLENIDSDESNENGLSDVSEDELVNKPHKSDNNLYTGFPSPRAAIQSHSVRNTDKRAMYNSDQRHNVHSGKAQYEAESDRKNVPNSYMDRNKASGTYSSIPQSRKSPGRSRLANRFESDSVMHTSQASYVSKPSQANIRDEVSNVTDARYFNVPSDAGKAAGQPNVPSYFKGLTTASHMTSNVNTAPNSGYRAPSNLNTASYHMLSGVHSVPSSANHMTSYVNTGTSSTNLMTSNKNMGTTGANHMTSNMNVGSTGTNHMTSNMNTSPSSTDVLIRSVNTGPSNANPMTSNVNTGTFTANYLTVSTAIQMQSSVNVMNPTAKPMPSNAIMPNKNRSDQLGQPVSNHGNMNNAINTSVPFTSGMTNTGSKMRTSKHPSTWINSRNTDFEKLTQNKSLTKAPDLVDLPSNKDTAVTSDVADVRKLLINQLQLLQQGVETDPTAIANIAEELKRLGQQKNAGPNLESQTNQPRPNVPTSSWPGTDSISTPQSSMSSYDKQFTNIPNRASSNSRWPQLNPASSMPGVQQQYSSVTQQQSRTHLLINNPPSQSSPRISQAYSDAHPTYQTDQFTGVLGASDSRSTSDSFQAQSTSPVYQTPTTQPKSWRNF